MTYTQIAMMAVGGLAVLTAGTYLLPRNVRVERTVTMAVPPANILAAAASSEGYQTFNPYKDMDPNLKITFFGPANGVGSGFNFEGKDGKGSSTVTAVNGSEVVYLIDLGSMGKPIQTIKAVADGGGSKVTWTMDSDMGMNPIGRVIGMFLDGMIGKNLEKGLANLASRTPVSN
jgi:Polyketide cyclase / dehydrase and lipid transport